MWSGSKDKKRIAWFSYDLPAPGITRLHWNIYENLLGADTFAIANKNVINTPCASSGEIHEMCNVPEGKLEAGITSIWAQLMKKRSMSTQCRCDWYEKTNDTMYIKDYAFSTF